MKDELERLRIRCAEMEEGLKTIAPHQASDLLRQLDRGESPSWASAAPSPSPSTTLNVSEADEGGGRLLYDQVGTFRYLGESSGATFLDHAYLDGVFDIRTRL
jgi:hypothetical protein